MKVRYQVVDKQFFNFDNYKTVYFIIYTRYIAQSLYEKKYTSYPRTDCKYLPESQYSDSNEVLEAIKKVNPKLTDIINNCDKSIHAPVWNTEKTTAHHAIIPTSSDNLGSC